MSIEALVRLLLTVTLIEMMVAVGLSVTLQEVSRVASDFGLVLRAAIANYLLAPAAALALMALFRPQPMVAVGFLIAAVCPGAPYGPPFTGLAKGNIAVSVGLMAMLAGSSAVAAPLLLRALMPLIAGADRIEIDAVPMAETLLLIQLLPLAAGVAMRGLIPGVAGALVGPAKRLAILLNLVVLALVLYVQWDTLADIPRRGFLGMLLLVLATAASGWAVGGPDHGTRRAIIVTTAVHNLGVSLVIANANFPDTPAVTAVLAYAVVQTLALALAVLLWGKVHPGTAARP
jgi:BASS family bile acid:Na+ symporter